MFQNLKSNEISSNLRVECGVRDKNFQKTKQDLSSPLQCCALINILTKDKNLTDQES